MAYDEKLADRIRVQLAGERNVKEHKMMGGLCFMVNGHMCCGVDGSDLFVRMERSAVDAALRRKYARRFAVGGKAPQGFVRVIAAGISNARSLRAWLAPAVSRANSLPKKEKKPKHRGKQILRERICEK